MSVQQPPHGGKLIDRTLSESDAKNILDRADEYQSIGIDIDLVKDVENIASGLFSPLEGFLSEADYESVLFNKRLTNDLAWTIPIVLDVTEEQAKSLKSGYDVILSFEDTPIALLHVEEIYDFNKRVHSEQVFGTTDDKHPGVAKTFRMKDKLVGGKIDLISETETPYYKYALKPAETRALFKEKGWETVVGFQ
ncbi:MAG: sulfate adenylyltransferase, partial [Methanosarcinaceae archaeon]|nr:sulfate adenylyltransferase [Methanosarcinaceae archaeon]